MRILRIFLLAAGLIGVAVPVGAQSPVQTSGALVIVPAHGEVMHVNDEAVLTFAVEEQDRDKAAAASRVNAKMKQGIEILKRQDPQASFKTHGYYSYPVYPNEQPGTRGRQPEAWRVGQYLEMTTANISGLPQTVAAAQRVLALNGLQFRLNERTLRKLDEARIEAAYQHLNARIAAIAKAMGRKVADAVLETVDFEASGAYAPDMERGVATMASAVDARKSASVEEPSFEPGETRLQMRVVGKVRFK